MYAPVLAAAGCLPLCRCDLCSICVCAAVICVAGAVLLCSPGGRMYVPVLAGAAGSPPLCRCDLCSVGRTPRWWPGLLGFRRCDLCRICVCAVFFVAGFVLWSSPGVGMCALRSLGRRSCAGVICVAGALGALQGVGCTR